jgi:hypothetical protein
MCLVIYRISIELAWLGVRQHHHGGHKKDRHPFTISIYIKKRGQHMAAIR